MPALMRCGTSSALVLSEKASVQRMRYAASAEMATACKVDENLHRWSQFRYSLILCVLCPVGCSHQPDLG